MFFAIGGGQRRDDAERRGDGGDFQLAGESLFERAHFLTHGARVGHDAPGPFEHALALGGQPMEARGAIDEEHAETFLELLDAGRQSGLRHPASLRRARKAALLGDGDEEFEFFDHGVEGVRGSYGCRCNTECQSVQTANFRLKVFDACAYSLPAPSKMYCGF